MVHDEPVRADRLVAILLMLQAKGQVTAAEVAEELEVSERTARRDLEALGTAGLPVYSVQGRGGGWKLAGGGHGWPGAAPILSERFMGPRTDVISATDEIWAFLARFSLPAHSPPASRFDRVEDAL